MEINYLSAPVRIGQVFQFNFRNCEVVKLHNDCFEFVYCNPSYVGKKRHYVTYSHWQANSYQKNGFGMWVLKGDYVPMWNTKEQKMKRQLRRMAEKLTQMSNSL